MARPPSADSIIRNAKQAERKVETHADIASDMILPNNSGEHTKGIKRDVPINDYDLSNKKYVDDKFPVTHASTTGQTTNDHHNKDHASEHETGGGDLVNHDSLTGFLANEHIDWTNATENLITIGDISCASLIVDTNTLVVNATGYTDKVGIGTATPSSALEVASGRIQITGNTVPSAGAGLELGYSTLGTVLAYDRDASAYKQLNLNGSHIGFFISGVQTAYLTDAKLGIGVDAVSNVLYPLHVSIRDANNNTVSNLMALDHRLTSGVGANGIGTGFILSGENSVGSRNGMMRFVGLLDDVTTGTVEGACRIDLNHHGAWTEAFKLSETDCIISKDVGIGTTSPDTKLQVVGDCKFGDDNTNYASFDTDGELTLTGTAKIYKSKTFTFNYSRITAQGKPTLVNRGVFFGWSLPIYSADDEELFTCNCIPEDWDGSSDPVVTLAGWIDTANNAKKFNMQVSVEYYDPVTNQVVPITTNDYTTETTTGNDAQYTSFAVNFTLDASAIGVTAGQPLGIRIRRLDASADEITGEFVVEGMVIRYLSDRLGGTS